MTTQLDPSIRDDFPFTQRLHEGRPVIYLDNAATTQKPRCVIDAMTNLYCNGVSNVHRALNFLAEEVTEAFERSRKVTARFIGARPNEIILTANATQALNMVSHWLAGQDKRILTTTLEHHSNLIPWVERGHVEFVDWLPSGKININDLKQKLQSRPALVTIGWCSNLLGTVQPLEEIIALCKNAGAMTLVDASQSLAHIPCNVKNLDCDFLIFSAHKLYGPSGVGVLYAKQSLLEKVNPVLLGGSMVKEVSSTSHVLNDLPYRFEAGTPNIEGVIGMGEALRYITQLGYKNIAAHENALLAAARERLGAMSNVTLVSPGADTPSAPLVTFTVKGLESTGVAKILSNRGNIIVRSGFHCAQPAHNTLDLPPTCRASFAVYNTLEEIDTFAEILEACSAHATL